MELHFTHHRQVLHFPQMAVLYFILKQKESPLISSSCFIFLWWLFSLQIPHNIILNQIKLNSFYFLLTFHVDIVFKIFENSLFSESVANIAETSERFVVIVLWEVLTFIEINEAIFSFYVRLVHCGFHYLFWTFGRNWTVFIN